MKGAGWRRGIHLTQGRALGGAISINGMLDDRGQGSSYDHWAQPGDPGWSCREIPPLFRRAERAIELDEDGA